MDIIKWMDERFYPGLSRTWDDALFREKLLTHINETSRILDYGAGRGKVVEMNFKQDAGFVAGVDIDSAVYENPYLNKAAVLEMPSGAIPFPDSEFDLVFSDNVMEHLENPESVFAEVFRVLKPGGIFMAKTPNRKHYMPMISSITPKQFHVFYNGLRGRDESDTFPTYYRCNSAAKVRSLSAETGFLVQSIDLVESRPEYLRLTSITYIFGLLYERIVNYVELLAGLRCVLIFSLQKPDSTQTD